MLRFISGARPNQWRAPVAPKAAPAPLQSVDWTRIQWKDHGLGESKLTLNEKVARQRCYIEATNSNDTCRWWTITVLVVMVIETVVGNGSRGSSAVILAINNQCVM